MRRFYLCSLEMLHQAPRQPVEIAGERAGRKGHMAAACGLFEGNGGRNLIRGGERPGRQKRIVSGVDDEGGHRDGLEPGLGRHLEPVVLGIAEAMQEGGDQRVEFAEGGGGSNRFGIQHSREAGGLAQGFGFEGEEKACGVDAAVEASIEGVAGRCQVERCGDALPRVRPGRVPPRPAHPAISAARCRRARRRRRKPGHRDAVI